MPQETVKKKKKTPKIQSKKERESTSHSQSQQHCAFLQGRLFYHSEFLVVEKSALSSTIILTEVKRSPYFLTPFFTVENLDL